jgi:pyridoxal phosphate enzyme (YggS family)
MGWVTMGKLKDNLQRTRDRIAAACQRVGRSPDSVALVAVTKTVGMNTVRKLVELGQRDLGENRVQQLTERAEQTVAWKDDPRLGAVRWHMIGHLQRNKVRPLLPWLHWLHSLDSLRLAEELNNQAVKTGVKIQAFLEVNASGERSKSGVAVGAATHLIEQVRTLPTIQIIGLMTMAPLVDNPESVRRYFVRTRELFDEIRSMQLVGQEFQGLSMGMSQDFEVAIEEGSTLVRVGTALFEGVQ